MQPVTTDKAFDFVRSQFIHSLKVEIQEFVHRLTQARHYHIATENDENVFLVALRCSNIWK